MSGKPDQPTDSDVGAAFLLWYAESLQQFPDGLVSQAQAAKMLGLNRMAVNRLVARGYLRAVYFPRMPEVPGIIVDEDDSTWLKLKSWFGKWITNVDIPDACYVSFGDVMELWLRGDAAKKCRLQWRELITGFRSKRADVREAYLIASARADQESAESLIRNYGLKLGKDMSPVGQQRVYQHDALLGWYDTQAEKLELTRNQLVFWALEQWKKSVEDNSPQASLPLEWNVDLIVLDTKRAVMDQCGLGVKAMWIRAVDEFGGDLGTYGATGLGLDGSVD